MAAERDLELLDDYLANRLDEQGRVDFEQRLSNDPSLRAEFELQQQFVAGIRKARVAELKTMMNNIPMSSIPQSGTSIAAKVAITAVIAGAVGTGVYFYLKSPSSSGISPVPPSEQTQTEPAEKDTNAAEEAMPHESDPVVSESPSSAEQKPVEKPRPIQETESDSQQNEQPQIEVYDPAAEDIENDFLEQSSEAGSPQLNENPTVEVEIQRASKKYTFHYQFTDGKLLLYGPFEKDLYEILEFFSENKRTVFLFHNEKYYLLRDDSEKLRPLSAIEDPALIGKLRQYRK